MLSHEPYDAIAPHHGGHSSDIAITATLKAIQSRQGSRHAYARMEQGGGQQTDITPELTAFMDARTARIEALEAEVARLRSKPATDVERDDETLAQGAAARTPRTASMRLRFNPRSLLPKREDERT